MKYFAFLWQNITLKVKEKCEENFTVCQILETKKQTTNVKESK